MATAHLIDQLTSRNPDEGDRDTERDGGDGEQDQSGGDDAATAYVTAGVAAGV